MHNSKSAKLMKEKMVLILELVYLYMTELT